MIVRTLTVSGVYLSGPNCQMGRVRLLSNQGADKITFKKGSALPVASWPAEITEDAEHSFVSFPEPDETGWIAIEIFGMPHFEGILYHCPALKDRKRFQDREQAMYNTILQREEFFKRGIPPQDAIYFLNECFGYYTYFLGFQEVEIVRELLPGWENPPTKASVEVLGQRLDTNNPELMEKIIIQTLERFPDRVMPVLGAK